jgi:hypothetical protein
VYWDVSWACDDPDLPDVPAARGWCDTAAEADRAALHALGIEW